MHVVKGDTVVVISGDDRGKTGRVLQVLTDKKKVLVEGVNFVKKHSKGTQQNPQGGIQEKEMPVHLSNVLPVCQRCGKGVRVKKLKLGDGRRVRACATCGEAVGTQ
ncbi:MAG: 50S ribosomal protein L24 [Candidatus Eisenbacteria sp.]|nr:50S ribosomal protein L24 [Candidatus Eisenbacteria bacterium]